ncbi:S-adenosyl-L-methionine-dependent methyltransferase, partial [Lasiosphaeria hispida]
MAVDDKDTKVAELLSYTLMNKQHESLIWLPRYRHRIAIASAWSIPPGSSVLDIGCGQGESSLTLALELGPESHITGIDTAALDYGTPYSIRQSQAHLLTSPYGSRISFAQTDAATLLTALHHFTAATLCHSLWYFPTGASVDALFATLARARVPRVYVAEYGFRAATPRQLPHLLAAQTLARLHAHTSSEATQALGADPSKSFNVRAAPDTEAIVGAAAAAGFSVVRQGVITPGPDYVEGGLEVKHVMGERFAAGVREKGLAGEREAEVLALAAKVRAAVRELGEEGVSPSMDVWWAEFGL